MTFYNQLKEWTDGSAWRNAVYGGGGGVGEYLLNGACVRLTSSGNASHCAADPAT